MQDALGEQEYFLPVRGNSYFTTASFLVTVPDGVLSMQ
jgi:hypothetical protein